MAMIMITASNWRLKRLLGVEWLVNRMPLQVVPVKINGLDYSNRLVNLLRERGIAIAVLMLVMRCERHQQKGLKNVPVRCPWQVKL